MTKSQDPEKIESSTISWNSIYKNIIEFTSMLPNADLDIMDVKTKENLLILINVIYENLDYLYGNIGIQLLTKTQPEEFPNKPTNEDILNNIKILEEK